MELIKPLIFSIIMLVVHFNKMAEDKNIPKRVKYRESDYDWKKNYYSGKEVLSPIKRDTL